MGSSAAATVISGCATSRHDEPRAEAAHSPSIEGAVPITLRINGKDHQLRIDPRATLLDCIREVVAFTGTKKGCDHGQCGACTVHVNGRRVNSCLSLALMHDGEEITTIPGSPKDGLPAMKIGAGEFVRRIVDSIRGTAASGGAPILTSATATAAWMRSFVEVMQSRRNGTAQDALCQRIPMPESHRSGDHRV